MTWLDLSYLHGTGAEPLTGLTVGGVLDAAAQQWPRGEALVVPHQRVRWSWQALAEQASRLAAAASQANPRAQSSAAIHSKSTEMSVLPTSRKMVSTRS